MATLQLSLCVCYSIKLHAGNLKDRNSLDEDEELLPLLSSDKDTDIIR